jgi:hypothetical protein
MKRRGTPVLSLSPACRRSKLAERKRRSIVCDTVAGVAPVVRKASRPRPNSSVPVTGQSATARPLRHLKRSLVGIGKFWRSAKSRGALGLLMLLLLFLERLAQHGV